MIDSWLRRSVIKNWSIPDIKQDHISLGNSGWTIADVKQHLRTEVVIALRNFSIEGKDGRVTKESTFVFGHLYNRIGQLMKRLTKRSMGYGIWSNNLEELLYEFDVED
jgi:hypothetical protein